MYQQPEQQNNTGIFPKFLIKPVLNGAKTKEAGRPIYDDREFVEIVIAGDSKTCVSHKVTDEHRNRWHREYQAFKQGLESPVDGTPLSEVPWLSASQVMELKALNIFNIEALANLPDTGINRIGMGGRELVKKAQAYIEAAKDGAALQKYAEENEKLKTDVKMLQDQIKELSSMLDDLTQDQKKGPGRPPKNG